ncbi:phosphate ABC transporter substrate-binding protein [candidate division GN15 bacterium]|nr:phosphate ABC transporter substrate-binding protein [candidate division GN15 bacterium]
MIPGFRRDLCVSILWGVLAFMPLLATAPWAVEQVTIRGSDTMVRLGQRWAEEYMKLTDAVRMRVSGGGSGPGIAAFLNGQTDICESSRDLVPSEYRLAEQRGISPHRITVARDGVAIFVNAENPIFTLTLDQVRDIFTGEITNWQELGWVDARIIKYSRDNSSGTFWYLQRYVMSDADFGVEVQTLPGTAAVVNAVARDKYGIGYGSIAWVTETKVIGLRASDTSEPIWPSLRTVNSGAYPITRSLYWFLDGEPTGELAELVAWVLSDEGQRIALQSGYYPAPLSGQDSTDKNAGAAEEAGR